MRFIKSMNWLRKRFDDRWSLIHNENIEKCEICEDSLKKVVEGGFTVYERSSLVTPSKFSIKEEKLHEVANAYGWEELIAKKELHKAEITDLSTIQIKEIIDLAKQRYQHLSMDSNIKSILFYHNNFSYPHFSFRLFALPIVPLDINNEFNKFLREKMKSGCIFCKLINELPAVAEDENIKVVKPFAQRFNYEFMILPKRHIKDITELKDDETLAISESILYLVKLLKSYNVNFYEIAFYNAPINEDFHLHIYVNSVELKDTLARYGVDLVYKGEKA